MMKRLIITFISVFVMSLTINTKALTSTSSELKNRSICSNFEVALANTDGSLTSVGCYTDYVTAKTAMDNSADNAVILERISGVTKIIFAKYGLVYLDQNNMDVTTNVYAYSSASGEVTYMNNSAYYGGTDGAIVELNYNNKAMKIRISGVLGWIKNGTYTVIPYTWVKSNSYYQIGSTNIRHYYAKNIENSGYSMMSYALGPKVEYLVEGNYYSYDGNYFYTDMLTMLKDYTTYKFTNSVNYDNPYYNYYMYLPHRSVTNYTVDDLDTYIRLTMGFSGSIYGKTAVSGYSTLYGTAEYFFNSQKLYGANAISVFSLARNESAQGRSSIAINKNNIFGHQAIDGSAYSSATGYLDIRSSIYGHGYAYINYGYSEVSDSRYRGGHFGNKNTGMNNKYASDVYWGEKAASYYYSFDSDNGLEDYDYYQLGLTTTEVNVRLSADTSSKVIYLSPKEIPLIILSEVEGVDVNGSKIWYQIQLDSNVDNNGNLIPSNSSTWPNYNWNGTGYIHSSYVRKINSSKNEDGTYNKPMETGNYNSVNYTTYASKTAYEPLVAKVGSNDINCYYSSSLLKVKGIIKANSLLTVLEESTDTNGKKYLVITDYSTYQKHWISASDVTLVEKDLLKVSIATSKGTINVLNTVNGTVATSIYSENFLPIIDKYTEGSNLWLLVQYQVMGTLKYGYVNTNDSNISYTLDHINRTPVLTATDKTLGLNSTYNLLDGITAIDEEDGDITDNIVIVAQNVDITKTGTYQVTYSIKDANDATVEKTITVTVKECDSKSPLFMYNNLEYKENNIFVFSGFLAVKGMDNTNIIQKLVFVNNETKEETVFLLTNWLDYPYEMSSLDDKEKYDYNSAWFKTEIDLSSNKISNGDYSIYAEVYNGTSMARTLFTNIAYMDMARRVDGDGRGFAIEVDYTTLNSPLLFSVRDTLISYDLPTNFDPMFNFFTNISLNDSTLNIKGTSHNIGVDLGLDKEVTRKLILENKANYNRYIFDLGSIIDGDYPITLAVSDNCDKTRAWYQKNVDLSSLPTGQYAIYIANTVDGKTHYGELIDIGYTNFELINTSKYQFTRNNGSRLRLELTVN